MDLKKIGAFITERRKTKGFTQNELAVKLCVTDRAVSKWECGKGMPDVSIMTPLCEILEITINELLGGEKIAEQKRAAQTEKQIMDLLTERQTNKRKIWWYFTIAVAGVLFFVASAIAAAYLIEFDIIKIWHGVLIIIFAMVISITLFTVVASAATKMTAVEK